MPAPLRVNISSSIACGTRPSSTTAASTPASTAWTQVSSLGIIPPRNRAVGLQRAMSAGVRSVSRLLALVEHARPRRSAGTAAPHPARCDRARHGVGVDVVGLAILADAIGAITGIIPAPLIVSMIVGSTCLGFAHKAQIDDPFDIAVGIFVVRWTLLR